MVSRAKISINADTLVLSGVLDFESVMDVDQRGREWLQGSAPAESNINLGALTYSSSVGVALLLGWLRVGQQQRKKIYIQQMPANLAALAKVGGLEELLENQ